MNDQSDLLMAGQVCIAGAEKVKQDVYRVRNPHTR